ncbi:MAG: hypothetical protein RR840_04340 [Clostridium sp.]
MARAVINLREFEFSGNILDISTKGSCIVPEIIETYNKDKIEKEFLECEEEIACSVAAYNSAAAILSINRIMGKKKLKNLLLEIKKSLIKNGKIVICDLNVGPFNIPSYYTIMLKLPGEKIMKMKYNLYLNPFRVRYKDVVESIEECGLKILKKKVDKGVYYIQCLNSEEAENEGNPSIT